MTARSKVTLIEAQQIRAALINNISEYPYQDQIADAIDALLALGLIDTDAALNFAAKSTSVAKAAAVKS